MKLTLSQIRKTIFTFALVILIGGTGYWLGSRQIIGFNQGRLFINFQNSSNSELIQNPLSEKEKVDLNLFWEVWRSLESSYLYASKLDPLKMVYGAASGLASSTQDPYTIFLTPEEKKGSEQELEGSFYGVGIELGYDAKDQLAVIAPLKGTPAELAGVRPGDLVLKIDDKETFDINLIEAVNLIRGPSGSKIRLTLLHEGEKQPFEVDIVRSKIIVKSVEVSFLDAEQGKKAAYLALKKFGDTTVDEWTQSIGEINSTCGKNFENCQGIILDLRNNPGGYFSSSVFIASEFLSSGTVVWQESGSGARESFDVNRQGQLIKPPLVVLINKGSASASEIVAGCLKEHQRAKLVGQKSFGKGTIQEARDLSGGTGLHITTARWLLPSGLSINGQGISPDFEVANDPGKPQQDQQLEKALSVLKTEK